VRKEEQVSDLEELGADEGRGGVLSFRNGNPS